MSLFYAQWSTVLWVPGTSFWLETSSSSASMFSLVGGGRIAAALSLWGSHCINLSLSASVAPVLTTTIACRKLLQFFSTITLILSQNFYQNLFFLIKAVLAFHIIQKRKRCVIIVTSWLIEYCHTGNFGFPVLILKYLNLKKYLVDFVQNCKIYSKDLLVYEIKG